MQSLPSKRWGNVRIIVGTIIGGVLGFYAMHRAELSYQRMWDERLKKYQEEKLREGRARVENTVQSS